MNTAPRFLKVALLLLAGVGIGVWAARNLGSGAKPEGGGAGTDPEASVVVPEPAHCVLVTYFTTDTRCPTCLKIEKQTRDAVSSAFANELASGEVRFQTLNLDRPENKRFEALYQLSFKTVVVSDRHQGKEAAWAKFDQVWDLVDKPAEFAACLQEGIRQYLKPANDA